MEGGAFDKEQPQDNPTKHKQCLPGVDKQGISGWTGGRDDTWNYSPMGMTLFNSGRELQPGVDELQV